MDKLKLDEKKDKEILEKWKEESGKIIFSKESFLSSAIFLAISIKKEGSFSFPLYLPGAR